MSKRQKQIRPTPADSMAQFAPWATLSRLEILGVGLIAVTALLAYYPALGGGFLLDDEQYLLNPLIKASDGLYRFWFTTEPVDYWPLTNTSFWIDWRLWGKNLVGYHLVNLVLHIVDALLIWVILRKLSIPGAWLAALLFAVHPVNVESVAWISQRKNVLSLLFFLLSIVSYLKADTNASRWYWFSLIAFILAMLCKGSVAMLPLVLLLIVWWQRGCVTKWDLARTAPFFVVAVALAAVNVWFQTHGSGEAFRIATIGQRLLGAGAVVWFYLYKALLPVNLVFIYPQWNIRVGDWRWWAPLLATVAVTAMLFWQRNSPYGRPLLFAWLFFCVALLPVMGFADVGFMRHSLVADHYQHIAIIGVVALLAATWSVIYQPAREAARSVRLRWMAAASLVVLLLTLLSWKQSRLYADPVTLYEATLAKNTDCWLADCNLGSALAARGRFPQAIDYYRQALRLKPDFHEAYNNLGIALFKTGRPEEAIQRFQQALNLKPDYVDAHNNLGNALADAGRLNEAITHFELSLRWEPDNSEAHNNLGNALLQSGRPREAVEHYQQTLRSNPDMPDTYVNLALAYADLKQPAKAGAAAQMAINLARSQGNSALVRQVESWLNSYRAPSPSSQDSPAKTNSTSPPP